MSLKLLPCPALICFGLAFAFLIPRPLGAITCTLQGELAPAVRSSIEQSTRAIAQQIAAGHVDQVKALTIPAVAAQFTPIADSVQRLAPQLNGATLTIDAMYSLDASDLKQSQDQTQFFCASPNSDLHEEVGIPQLPAGAYALALVHATGIKQPEQMGMLLQRANNGQWQLAGFFDKALESDGHNSLWYWTQARHYAQEGQAWNAYFYYTVAAELALPVGFLSTPNLRKLLDEQNAVKADGLPVKNPLVLQGTGESYTITGFHTDSSLGGLDLVVEYATTDTSDPVATRTRILGLMKALLTKYPQLRGGFHGIWVFANAPGQRPFAIEQPMDSIH
jgi:hypothetical protein